MDLPRPLDAAKANFHRCAKVQSLQRAMSWRPALNGLKGELTITQKRRLAAELPGRHLPEKRLRERRQSRRDLQAVSCWARGPKVV